MQNKFKTFTGEVISVSSEKTVVIALTRLVKHRKYHKTMKKTSKLMAHDPNNSCKLGETITIRPCAPKSKRKVFEVVYSTSSEA